MSAELCAAGNEVYERNGNQQPVGGAEEYQPTNCCRAITSGFIYVIQVALEALLPQNHKDAISSMRGRFGKLLQEQARTVDSRVFVICSQNLAACHFPLGIVWYST